MSLLEVKIPPMGESITSGVLAKWHVREGDWVRKDQPLFELETDKITSESAAEAAGKIELRVDAGAEVKIGQVVAAIDTDASAPVPAPEPTKAASVPEVPAAAPVPAGAAETKTAPKPSPAPAGAPRRAKPAEPAIPTAAIPSEKSSPASPVSGERQTRKKMSPLRQRIAQRLVAAQREAAMLTTFNEADMSGVIALRTKFQEDFVKRHGVKLGFMSFFAKAVVRALKEVPSVNAQVDGDEIVENHYFDLGIAVSTEKGLMVPVIRGCDRLSLADIEKAVADAALKARESRITLNDLEGGVFTITNGGIFGSMLSTPILNPPQSAILGLHAISDRPVAVNGQVVVRPMMYLALSYDHRIVDGRDAVTFLVKVKQAVEEPTRMMLGL